MKLNINPFNRGNPMKLKDAAVVSVIAASGTYVLTFLVNTSLGQVLADPAAFAFESVKTWLVSFFGTFGTLTGLETLMKRGEKQPES